MSVTGLYFEELAPGRVVDAEWTRTVTDADNTLFCGMTMNVARLHLDAEYMRGTEFGRPLVNSLFTLGLMVGPAPVFAGDTLSTITTVVSARESRSRADSGIVTFRHDMRDQRGELVATCERAALMLRRPA